MFVGYIGIPLSRDGKVGVHYHPFCIWSSSSKRLCTLQTICFTKHTPVNIVFCNLLRKRNVFCMCHHICNPMLNHQWSGSLWKKTLQTNQSKASVFPWCISRDFLSFPCLPFSLLSPSPAQVHEKRLFILGEVCSFFLYYMSQWYLYSAVLQAVAMKFCFNFIYLLQKILVGFSGK